MVNISDEQIKQNVTLEEAFDWVSYVIKNKHDMILPAKISMKPREHVFYNTMPCILPNEGVVGVKIVNRYPENNPILKSNLVLYNYANGDLEALMDANYITTLRTGAVAAHSMLLFAKEDYKTIALIGLGHVTKMAFRVFLQKYDQRKIVVKIYDYMDDANIFIREFQNQPNIEIQVFKSYDELIKDSDIIVSGIAYADHDFTDIMNYKKGCTVIPIHTLGFQNCDRVFDKVYGDDYNHIKDFKYFNEFKNFNEVCDVVNNNAIGRENQDERILVYNIGIALHDIYFAKKVFEKLN